MLNTIDVIKNLSGLTSSICSNIVLLVIYFSCQEPYDYIPRRSYPLFLAREALQAVITDIHHRALHPQSVGHSEED
jgi:hypothetical protein